MQSVFLDGVWFTDFPSELQLFMLPLLDSLLGCRLMFLVSSTAMPVSVLLWMGAPFSFLVFPSGWKRSSGKITILQSEVLSFMISTFRMVKDSQMRRSVPAPFVFTKFKAKASRQLSHLNKTGNESVVCGIRVKLMTNHSFVLFFLGGGAICKTNPCYNCL